MLAQKMAAPELTARLTGKLSCFRSAVETEKGQLETEHSNRNSRYTRFAHHVNQSENIPGQQVVAHCFEHHERKGLLAKSKVWTTADFEALRVLGEGSFGVVYLARKNGEEGFFALKQMKKTAYARKNHRERVFAERDILAEAESRWIVNLYSTFHDAEHAYMVMEFLQGGDLIGHLLKKKRFSQQETSFYMAELLEALNTVHRCGFVHRDVKPDNVVLTTQGHLKLLDFGLCHHDPLAEQAGIDSCAGQNRRAQLKSMVGTPQYMAPEVYEAEYGPEADIWSVGIITYECLVGIVPFHGGQYHGRDAIKIIRKKIADHVRVLGEQLVKAKMRGYIGQAAENFLLRMVCVRERRLNVEQCRGDPFFVGIDFQRLHELQPPIVPSVSNPADTTHFDSFEFRALSAARVGAKDVSMEWVHYDFNREKKDLHRADARFENLFVLRSDAEALARESLEQLPQEEQFYSLPQQQPDHTSQDPRLPEQQLYSQQQLVCPWLLEAAVGVQHEAQHQYTWNDHHQQWLHEQQQRSLWEQQQQQSLWEQQCQPHQWDHQQQQQQQWDQQHLQQHNWDQQHQPQIWERQQPIVSPHPDARGLVLASFLQMHGQQEHTLMSI